MAKFPVTRPVNTAAKLTGSSGDVDFRLENCAACTAGALTGKTSGELIAAVFGSFKKPLTGKAGYEPATAFAKLGEEARAAKGKGPKFTAGPQGPDVDANQYSLQVGWAKGESSTHAQIKALRDWVLRERGGSCKKLGSVQTAIPQAEAKTWMALCDPGTEFAVYFTSHSAQTVGHWVYAHNVGHSVEFCDYQQYLPTGAAPEFTSKPTCMNLTANDGKLIVLAFTP